MDVKTLCLGLLTEGDKTGYEIKRCFETGFSHFFGAGFGSIYPALAELSHQGLVTCRSVEQDKRPDKKVYRLTAAGHRLLLDELMATSPRHKVRSEFLVLIYFAHLLPPDRVARIIDQMISDWEPLIREVKACAAAADQSTLTPGMRFAAGYGLAVLGAGLAYVREHRADLVGAVARAATPAGSERIALAGD